MKPYLCVIYWRQFTWVLKAWAQQPGDLRGIARDFDEHPISLQVIPR